MTSTRAQLIVTAQRFVDSYNSWRIDNILAIRSPNCIHHTLPKSLHGSTSYTNAEFRAFFTPMMPLLRNFQAEIVGGDTEEGFIVDAKRRKVVMQLKGHAESDVGIYMNEYIIVLGITEDAKLVEEIVEFLDSGYTDAFFGKFQGEDQKNVR